MLIPALLNRTKLNLKHFASSRAIIQNAREEAQTLFEENAVEISAVVEAVGDYKETSTEEDEAKESWGEARSVYAHAKSTVILARLNNLQKLADRYGDAEGSAELNEIIAQLEAIADEIAVAAADFDKEEVKSLAEEARELVKEAKELAKDMREDVRESRKAVREEMKLV